MPKLSEVAMKVLKSRYFIKDDYGTVIEDWDQLVTRVATAIGKAEIQYSGEVGAERAVKNMECFVDDAKMWIGELDFLPNSPTLMNASITGGQLSACFVLGIDDDIESIFDAVKQMAMIFKSGGGVGLPMSRLRPEGSLVKSTGGVSSGPVSFMRVYNTTAEVVAQGGKRRGALMGTLRVDHPDVLKFIKEKQDLTKLTSFNVSVGITDEFVKALRDGGDIALRNPATGETEITVAAQDIWNDIVECAWKTGEPGIVFLDRMNETHQRLTGIDDEIEGTNPCGEIPLLAYESCNLGSINLARFVKNPYTKDSEIDYARLEAVAGFGTRFLDNVITVNNYPLDQIREATLRTRKIGLGVMGFAEMLVMLGARYGHSKSYVILRDVMHCIREAGHATSEALADERGPYNGGSRRNATITAVAPTGSISMIADVTGGIEPMFAVKTKRESVLDGKPFYQVNAAVLGLLRAYNYPDLAEGVVKDGNLHWPDSIPEEFRDAVVPAHKVDPDAHVAMQAAAQVYVDNAVSKSVNLQKSATVADVARVFELAYDQGCKGITVYRDGCRAHQPMSAPAPAKTPEETYDIRQTKAKKLHVKPGEQFVTIIEREPDGSITGEGHMNLADATPEEQAQFRKWIEKGYVKPLGKLHMKERPTSLPGHTIKMKTGCGTLFVTVSRDENGAPVELFAHHGKAGICSAAQCEAIGRLSSMALRVGIDPQDVADQLRGITCHETAGIGPNKVLSCADGIAKAILHAIGESVTKDDGAGPVYTGACQKCGSGLVREAGCIVCKSCGWEKCT